MDSFGRPGELKSFDAPESTQTIAFSINSKNSITGYYVDSSNVAHGYLRSQ